MSNRTQLLGFSVLFFLMGVLISPHTPFAQAQSKDPKWSHAFSLAARKHTEKDFDANTRRYGIECFRDENNGNLIYITETGSIAVVPGK